MIRQRKCNCTVKLIDLSLQKKNIGLAEKSPMGYDGTVYHHINLGGSIKSQLGILRALTKREHALDYIEITT